jgi:translation initiation factor 2 subunit 1
LDADEIDDIVETARQNVSVPYVNVTGYVDLRCPTGDGVDHIKDALKAAEGEDIGDELELEVTYVGSPEYRVKVRAPDYKTAETALEDAVARATESIEQSGGSSTFHRERHEDDE